MSNTELSDDLYFMLYALSTQDDKSCTGDRKTTGGVKNTQQKTVMMICTAAADQGLRTSACVYVLFKVPMKQLNTIQEVLFAVTHLNAYQMPKYHTAVRMFYLFRYKVIIQQCKLACD